MENCEYHPKPSVQQTADYDHTKKEHTEEIASRHVHENTILLQQWPWVLP